MSEEKKHLSYFKVENFKRFSTFELKDIGQFNVIVGDNNVGKTSLLEALMFDENKLEMSSQILSLLRERKILYGPKSSDAFESLNVLNQFIKNRNSETNSSLRYSYRYLDSNKLNSITIDEKESIKLTESEIKSLNGKFTMQDISKYSFIFCINDAKEIVPVSYKYIIDNSNKYMPFVPYYLGYESDFVDFYSEKVQTSKMVKSRFLDDLKLFIPDVEDIEISIGLIPEQPLIVVRILNIDGVIPLASFGLGAVKLVRLILEIYQSNKKRIMIDEFDTGIYYKRLEGYWKTILKAAVSNETQLFVTTHNWECLEYFANILSNNDMEDYREKARICTLRELPDGNVKAYSYKYNEFRYAIENRHEIRGE